MRKIVLITGANGMLAKQLSKQLQINYYVRFLTREVINVNDYLWDVDEGYIDVDALKGVHTIVHLAGASIADRRWSRERKETIISSRVNSATLILDALKREGVTIDTFISASAIGYYGTTTTNNIFTEESPKGDDFLSSVCSRWEEAADSFRLSGVARRVAVMRIGVILAKEGGVLKRIVQPIKCGVGAAVGTGRQYIPWIDIKDLSSAFNFIIDNRDIEGVFNAVSPEQTTNIELTKRVASLLNRVIVLPNIPKQIIHILFGEMGVILLYGSRVSPSRLIQSGFKFKYSTLSSSLDRILKV